MDLYIDPVATTSRAVLAMCRHEQVDVELRFVSLMKGEHHADTFARLNPNRMVPVLVDDGFVLTESSAILRYLARSRSSALYPAGLQEAARVDEMLAWFESNFYKDFGYQYVYPQLLPHHARGTGDATRATVEWGRKSSHRWLQVLDAHFLAHGQDYLTGRNLSIADFHGVSILSLGELVGCDLGGYPRVEAWNMRMKQLASWRAACEDFEGFVASVRGAQVVAFGEANAALA
jgi:glutathione S-transferase